MHEMKEDENSQIYSIASLITVMGGWTGTVTQDEVGPYISITTPHTDALVRALALSEKEQGQDRYWQFWNNDGLWLDSHLPEQADIEDILTFLTDALREETLLSMDKHPAHP